MTYSDLKDNHSFMMPFKDSCYIDNKNFSKILQKMCFDIQLQQDIFHGTPDSILEEFLTIFIYLYWLFIKRTWKWPYFNYNVLSHYTLQSL